VDEYLSEKEQVERLRAWWKENGLWIIGGLVAGVLLLVGWNAWQDYRLRQSEEASVIYATLAEATANGRTEDARAQLDRLAEDYAGTPYLQQGRLALASALVRAGSLGEAEPLLSAVMKEAGSDDEELALVARVRLARLLAAQGESVRALAMTDAGDDAGAFSAALQEVRGDILADLGDTAKAREAYERAISAGATGAVDAEFVRMKLRALGPPEAAAGDAAETGEASDAEDAEDAKDPEDPDDAVDAPAGDDAS
jgi:predicted negative regulator of RcsB-dependent stress response